MTTTSAIGHIAQAVENSRSRAPHALAHLYCARLSEPRWPRVEYGNAELRAMSSNRRRPPQLRLTLACRN
jgi:hypothetical protein